MILVDWQGRMVSDQNPRELHEFAGKLGLTALDYSDKALVGEQWRYHYKLNTKKIKAKAFELGAEMVSPKELCERAGWAEGKQA